MPRAAKRRSFSGWYGVPFENGIPAEPDPCRWCLRTEIKAKTAKCAKIAKGPNEILALQAHSPFAEIPRPSIKLKVCCPLCRAASDPFRFLIRRAFVIYE